MNAHAGHDLDAEQGDDLRLNVAFIVCLAACAAFWAGVLLALVWWLR